MFSLGLVVGTRLTDVTQTTTVAGINYLRNSTLFTVGPSLQVSLPAGLRLEVDALYRPVAYRIATAPPSPLHDPRRPCRVTSGPRSQSSREGQT